MQNTQPGFLKRLKKRRILVLSAGGIDGGIQCLYFCVTNDSWEIIAHVSMPYPQKISTLFNTLSPATTSSVPIDDLADLDYKLSHFLTEVAKTTLSKSPTGLRKPHCLLLVKPCLWKNTIKEGAKQQFWNLSFGDAQFIASTLGVPVFTDFIRQHCIAGGNGILPVDNGNQRIASLSGGTVVLVNIGLVSRMTIVDTRGASIRVDSDTGPGTCGINTVMRQHFNDVDHEGFDRDGSLASKGVVDGECLTELASAPWFLESAPKQAIADQFNQLLKIESFTVLSMHDQLSTVTALTARTIYDFFRKEFSSEDPDVTVFVSGGGSHNQTLLHYLQTYFDTIPVKSIEELGIPADMRIPLAFGLTINSLIRGESISWESGTAPMISSPGRWITP